MILFPDYLPTFTVPISESLTVAICTFLNCRQFLCMASGSLMICMGRLSRLAHLISVTSCTMQHCLLSNFYTIFLELIEQLLQICVGGKSVLRNLISLVKSIRTPIMIIFQSLNILLFPGFGEQSNYKEQQ